MSTLNHHDDYKNSPSNHSRPPSYFVRIASLVMALTGQIMSVLSIALAFFLPFAALSPKEISATLRHRRAKLGRSPQSSRKASGESIASDTTTLVGGDDADSVAQKDDRKARKVKKLRKAVVTAVKELKGIKRITPVRRLTGTVAKLSELAQSRIQSFRSDEADSDMSPNYFTPRSGATVLGKLRPTLLSRKSTVAQVRRIARAPRQGLRRLNTHFQ